MHGNNWQSAPTLVSDFRLIKRNRSFPKRNISQNELISILDQTTYVIDISKIYFYSVEKYEVSQLPNKINRTNIELFIKKHCIW